MCKFDELIFDSICHLRNYMYPMFTNIERFEDTNDVQREIEEYEESSSYMQ